MYKQISGSLFSLLFVIPALAAPPSGSAENANSMPHHNVAQFVDPIIGTGAVSGQLGVNAFPGADVPFGMVQWSPDTPSRPPGGGYHYGDSAITGFSLTHISGPGCAALGDIPILPVVGALPKSPGDAADPFTHADEHASAGYYQVRLDATGNGALSAIPSSALTPSHGNTARHGLTGHYYNNQHLKGKPALTRTDRQVNFNWGSGSPGSGVPSDHFSARWTGVLTPPQTGRYTLGVKADDGSRLYVNGKRVASTWKNHKKIGQSEPMKLVKGHHYQIRVDYYENAGDASIKLGWRLHHAGPVPHVKTKLTVTTHTGIGTFTFPQSKQSHLLIKTSGSAAGNSAAGAKIVGKHEVDGYAKSGHFCGAKDTYKVYFAAKFDRPFTQHGTWKDGTWKGSTVRQGAGHVSGSHSGAYVTFDTSRHRTVNVKVGVSFVSLKNAKQNLNAEQSGYDFDAVHKHAVASWNRLLNRIQVKGGTTNQKKIFYTALYHALLHPNVFSDVNGQYTGYDGKVHQVKKGHASYANYSGWDIYRSQVQLAAMLAPHRMSDVVRTMLEDYKQTGMLPKWSLAHGESYVMVGDPADAIIADAYAFGARDFDTKFALKAMRAEATKPNKIRPGLKTYEAKGYLPSDKENYGCCNFYGSVSTAEEYETADFAIAAFAHRLGDSSAARFFARRAQNWKNNFNRDSDFMQPKLKNGHFAPHFDPTSGQGFVEGDSYQYTPMVPFNVHGLIQAAGGNARYMRYLDKFFRKLNTDGNSRYAWQGNEPGLEIPWEYDYAGQPWRTQKVVRRIQDELYKAEPAGEAGNDDLGAMSSWYVWSALGLYPETPGTADFALGSPLFKHMTVYLPNGKTIAIDAPNASDATPYVQKLTLDGRKWAHNYLRPSILKHGAKLKFKLSSKPNRQRGTKPEDAPPSYSQF